MDPIILHSTSLKEFQEMIGEIVEEKLRQLKQDQPIKTSGDYVTRQMVCDRLRISLATLHSYTKSGILKGYRIGGRVLYRSDEIEQAVNEIEAQKYRHSR